MGTESNSGNMGTLYFKFLSNVKAALKNKNDCQCKKKKVLFLGPALRQVK